MKKYLLILLLILIYLPVSSQNRNSIWMFGDSAGINFSNINNPIPVHSSVKSRGSCVSIGDKNGNLFFYGYTRAGLGGMTTVIKNKNHVVMPNGDSIAGRAWYQELVIVPDPGDSLKYYLFSLSITSIYGVYYSIIDMSLDNGNGDVTIKNIQLQTWEPDDGIIAIKHGNGRDWWVIAKRGTIWTGTNLNEWYLYLVDSSGVQPQPLQTVGSLTHSTITHLSFDPINNKICFLNYLGLVETYNFDRCTGLISNPISLSNEGELAMVWSSAFSPFGQYLYISTYDTIAMLYQYDLYASNIAASRITIDSFAGFPWPGGMLRLAPDNKIYYSMAWYDGFNNNFPYPDTSYNMYNMNLSVINDPDQPGLACNFTPFSFYLGGKRTYWGLPNNPDYELGPLSGSMCDTIVNVIEHPPPNKKQIYFYPVPAKNEIYCRYFATNKTILRIKDISGRIMLEVVLQKGNINSVNTEKLSNGFYFAEIETGEGKIIVEKIEIIK